MAGWLDLLITDTFVQPGSVFARLCGARGRERYHEDLQKAPVKAWNWRTGLFETRQRARRNGWDLIIERNNWLQQRAVSCLRSLQPSGGKRAIFSYSYAAHGLFRYAKSVGWQTVLGQIDPGPEEERLVTALHADSPRMGGRWSSAPYEYWKRWKEECDLADAIVVNSDWSKEALIVEGIPASKIRIIPLVYEPPTEALGFQRRYPAEFSPQRPLKVLFLGQINLRKGIGPLLEAVSMMEGVPVQFQLVGPVQIEIPDQFRNHPQVEWMGPVPRGAAAAAYRQADVFLFPTMSDGYGLTQLEAQAWQLPIIASRRCGSVVENGKTGWILAEVTAERIASVLRACVTHPDTLNSMSRRIRTAANGLLPLANALQDCIPY